MKPQILKISLLSIQVCVPENWTDEQVVNFTNTESPSGPSGGWLCREGELKRVPCDVRVGFVHIVLEAACLI